MRKKENAIFKKSKRKRLLLSHEVILAAIRGEELAVGQVLTHYEHYISGSN